MAGKEIELRSRYEITVASQTILLRLLMPFLIDGGYSFFVTTAYRDSGGKSRVRTPADLSRTFRDQVLREAKVKFVA